MKFRKKILEDALLAEQTERQVLFYTVTLQLLQHQRQECTIGKNSCFWLLNAPKAIAPKVRKTTPLATTFLTCTISNNIRSNGKKAWKIAGKSDPYRNFFFIKYYEQYHCRNEFGSTF